MQTLEKSLADDLISAGPADDARAALAAFAPLIGSWDLRFVYRRATGERIEGSGYVHFSWGLGGRAIVDIFGFDGGVVGTTIRYYDPKIDAFRSTWICPIRNALVSFIGRVVDGKIVLNALAADPPGRRIRWSFVSITAERFSWTGEVSDDGSSWLLVQEIEGTRR